MSKRTSSRLDRRTLLRGLAGVALGLPFFEAMEDRAALAGGAPKRLVVFFTPNGTIPDAWVSGTETSFTLGPILQPLAPYQGDIIVTTGIDNQAATHGPGDDHQRGIGTMLTGIELQPGTYQGGCTTCPAAGWAGGASLDQIVAQKIGSATKLPSMEFGVDVGGSDDWSRMSYSGPGTPMPPIDDPVAAYARLFANLDADPAGQKLLVAQRHLVLGSIMTDAQKLRAGLGAADQIKLDQHLASLNTINQHLDQVVTVGGACKQPAAVVPVGDGDIESPANFGAIGKLQMDMLVMALTCDITRVASLQWTRSVGDVVYGLGRRHRGAPLALPSRRRRHRRPAEPRRHQHLLRPAARLLDRPDEAGARGHWHALRQHRHPLGQRARHRQRAFAQRHALPARGERRGLVPDRALPGLQRRPAQQPAAVGGQRHGRRPLDLRQPGVLHRAAQGL